MKGIIKSIPPLFTEYKLRTATEECQKVNPIFYLKSSSCPHAGCSTCHSVERWRGEDWQLFWNTVQSENKSATSCCETVGDNKNDENP
jgi:hypothetical protein